MAKILTIIPYHFYPPKNGGTLRCFHILKAMARQHQVFLVTSQHKSDFEKPNGLPFPSNVQVISTRDSSINNFRFLPKRLINAIIFRLLRRTLLEPTNSYFLEAYPIILRALSEIKPDIVYFENLEALGFFGSLTKKMSPRALRIYDAHNVDSELWSKLAQVNNNPDLKKYALGSLKAEKRLSTSTSFIFTCSQIDLNKLNKLNNGKVEAVVIPNGVDQENNIFDFSPNKHLFNEIIFCGDLTTHANKEGILWFYYEVFPLLLKLKPNLKFTIIGHFSNKRDYQALINDDAVNFVGPVTSVIPYYMRSSIAIVPLLSGSGTRLKILEAMSMGNPVVSTGIGAEGIECTSGKDILISDDPSSFANQIALLLNDHTRFEEIRYNAADLVNSKYQWKQIGDKINIILNRLISTKKNA